MHLCGSHSGKSLPGGCGLVKSDGDHERQSRAAGYALSSISEPDRCVTASSSTRPPSSTHCCQTNSANLVDRPRVQITVRLAMRFGAGERASDVSLRIPRGSARARPRLPPSPRPAPCTASSDDMRRRERRSGRRSTSRAAPVRRQLICGNRDTHRARRVHPDEILRTPSAARRRRHWPTTTRVRAIPSARTRG